MACRARECRGEKKPAEAGLTLTLKIKFFLKIQLFFLLLDKAVVPFVFDVVTLSVEGSLLPSTFGCASLTPASQFLAFDVSGLLSWSLTPSFNSIFTANKSVSQDMLDSTFSHLSLNSAIAAVGLSILLKSFFASFLSMTNECDG